MKQGTPLVCVALAVWLCVCTLPGCADAPAIPKETSKWESTETDYVTAEETEASTPDETECATEPAMDTEEDTSFETESDTWQAMPCESTSEVADTETGTSEETEGESIPVPSEPLFNLEGYTIDEVIHYFHEVVHSGEYSFGYGQMNVIHKWEKPIYYKIHGGYTDEDMRVLTRLFGDLNAVDGFPGIHPAENEEDVLVNIYFYDQNRMMEEFGYLINHESAEGLMTYWYSNDTNEILNAVVCYRMDITQAVRNSVLVEEIVNMLGMPNDTRTRPDSVLYQYNSLATELSRLDWLFINLLYSPWMKCGYNCDATATVVRALCVTQVVG